MCSCQQGVGPDDSRNITMSMLKSHSFLHFQYPCPCCDIFKRWCQCLTGVVVTNVLIFDNLALWSCSLVTYTCKVSVHPHFTLTVPVV